MVYCWNNLVKPKRYIQFNDLVFTGRKSIEEQSESLSFRVNKTARTFTHGSYVANRGKTNLVEDNTISVKIALRTSHWDDEHVRSHYDFIMQQLTTPGKLWAIQPGMQLVWCNAYVTSIEHASEWVITDDGYLVFNVEFDNADGVWYKAKDAYTYLEEWELCDFLNMKADCLGKTKLCCNVPLNCNQACECCENDSADLCDMVNMCDMMNDLSFLNDFYEECNAKWRVVYNCNKCKEDNRDLNELYPHTICDICTNDVLAGSFLSTTTLDSHKWSLAIMGKFQDPKVILNDNEVQVFGTYDGVLTFDYTGEVKFASNWDCIEYAYDEVPLTQFKICASSPYVKPGRNQVSLEGILSDTACIYIDYESVTL